MRRAGILLGCALLVVSALGAARLAAQGPKAPASGRRVVAPAGGPVAGSYSPGVQVGPRLFLSGQLGRDPKTGALPTGVREQTRQGPHDHSRERGRGIPCAGVADGGEVDGHQTA